MYLNLLHRRFEGVKEEMQTQRLYAYENIFTYGGLLVILIDSYLHFYIFRFYFYHICSCRAMKEISKKLDQ